MLFTFIVANCGAGTISEMIISYFELGGAGAFWFSMSSVVSLFASNAYFFVKRTAPRSLIALLSLSNIAAFFAFNHITAFDAAFAILGYPIVEPRIFDFPWAFLPAGS